MAFPAWFVYMVPSDAGHVTGVATAAALVEVVLMVVVPEPTVTLDAPNALLLLIPPILMAGLPDAATLEAIIIEELPAPTMGAVEVCAEPTELPTTAVELDDMT